MEEKQLYYIWLSNTFRAGSPVPKLLLTHFKSIEEMINADVSQLAQVPTITNKVAEDIYNFFRQKEKHHNLHRKGTSQRSTGSTC